MKNIFVILVLISFTSLFAQTNEKEVDVRSLVNKQVAAARQKAELRDGSRSTDLNRENKKITKSSAAAKTETDSTPVKILILLTVSVIVFSFVAVRRNRLSKRKIDKGKLKTGVKILRSGKALKPVNNNLIKVRKSLKINSVRYNMNQYQLSEIAKKLSISKSEILLARRIGKYEILKAKSLMVN